MSMKYLVIAAFALFISANLIGLAFVVLSAFATRTNVSAWTALSVVLLATPVMMWINDGLAWFERERKRKILPWSFDYLDLDDGGDGAVGKPIPPEKRFRAVYPLISVGFYGVIVLNMARS